MMRLQGQEIVIQRGETFAVDYVLQNRDGSPYIITNKSHNPYFLLTISSTKYTQEGRYIKNYWLEIPKQLRFYVTNAIKRDDFNSIPTLPDNETYDDIDTYAVYYTEDANGNKTYKRWLNNSWVDYELRINKAFLKADTIEWVGQSYIYSLNYVDGISMLEYLTEAYSKEFPTATIIPDTVEELYNSLKHINDYSDLSLERELYDIQISIPIVSNIKLSVIGNINGGIL